MIHRCRLHISVGFLLAAMLLFAGISGAAAQEKKLKTKDVPASVMSTFKKDFPKAKIQGASTEKEKGTVFYEIESMDGKTRRDLRYSADGKMVEMEETVPASALPEGVMTALHEGYPKSVIERAERVMRDSVVTYELLIKVGGKKKEVAYDAAGGIVDNKEGKEEKDDDEDEDD